MGFGIALKTWVNYEPLCYSQLRGAAQAALPAHFAG